MRRNLLLAIVPALFAILPGCLCQPSDQPSDINPDDGLARPGGGERTALIHNDYHPNGLRREALTANGPIRTMIAGNPLNKGTIDRQRSEISALIPTTTDQTLTNELLNYILSCALTDSQIVTLGDDQLRDERGLGLCPEWFSMRPSNDCLEIVSSCVLARVNAVGKRVIISVRGRGIELQPHVRVEKQLRGHLDPNTMMHVDDDIDSFKPCGTSVESDKPTRNCGWQALYVGRCVNDPMKPDARVTLTPRSSGVMLRACKGLYGCNNDPSVPVPAYAGWLGDTNGKEITFPCPKNGPLEVGEENSMPGDDPRPRYGYFSMMIAHKDASVSANPLVLANDLEEMTLDNSDMNVKYPANEAEVFTFREGAFYGNLFSFSDDDGGTNRPMLGGVKEIADINACFGEHWSCGLAHLTDRFCAGAGSDLAPTSCDLSSDAGTDGGINGCFNANAPPEACMPPPTTARCDGGTGSPDNYYQDCASFGGSPRWQYPITTYLNHPCDLSADEQCGYSKFGQVPTCVDGVKNGNETDVDCGGGECVKCDYNQGCSTDADCKTGFCNPSNNACTAQTLATGQDYPRDIAVDATSVYWTNVIGHTLMKVSLTGTNLTQVASGQNLLLGVAVDATYVYWSEPDNDRVMKAPIGGGLPVLFAQGAQGARPWAVAVDQSNVYWTNDGNGTIMKAPVGGGAPTQLASYQAASVESEIAIDSTNVYWTNHLGGEVAMVPIAGGNPTVLSSGQKEPAGIAVSPTHVYWANHGVLNSSITRKPIAGGPAVGFGGKNSWGIAVDATSVYWTEPDAIWRAALDGSNPTVLASGLAGAWMLAVDATSVYWTEINMASGMGLVRKVAK